MRKPGWIERNVYSDRIYIAGKRDTLIAAGVCKPDCFPGDANDPRTCDHRGVRHGVFHAIDPHGRSIKISKHPGDVFRVTRTDLTELEAAEGRRNEREEEERHEEWKRKEEAEREAREAERNRNLYATAEKFRDSHAYTADLTMLALLRGLDGRFGWRLCDEDRARVVSLKAALVATIQNARIVRDGESQEPRLRLVKK